MRRPLTATDRPRAAAGDPGRPDLDDDAVMAAARDVESTGLDPADILVRDQVAVVTGGGGGIGQGIALGLARFGADVAVLDIVADRQVATVQAIERLGRRAHGVTCDVMDPVQLRAGIAEACESLGGLDILVNNAGGVRATPFLRQSERSIRRHVDVNLTSMLIATHEAAQTMVRSGRGTAIVNVSSVEATRGAPMYAVYAACKAAMVNFTKTMALELSGYGIRVNCIAPDHTITPGVRGNREGPVDPATWDDTSAGWAGLIPLGREGLVEECAAAVIWLCSDMARYVTGITVNVDGGTSASSGWLRQPDGAWTLDPALRHSWSGHVPPPDEPPPSR